MNEASNFGEDKGCRKANGTSKILGKILKNERRKRSISQLRLSDMADVNNSYYCCVEQGYVNLSVFKLVRICKCLEVEPAYVMSELSRLENHSSTSGEDKNSVMEKKFTRTVSGRV